MAVDDNAITGAIESAAADITESESPLEDAADAAPVPTEAPAAEGVTESSAPRVKRGPIPFDRHEAVLTKTRNAHKAELDAVNGKLATLSWAEKEGIRDRLDAMGLAETNPEAFMKILAALNPAYEKLLAGAPQPAKTVPAAETSDASDPQPKPDVQNDDGSLGYSEKGLRALIRWEAREEMRDRYEARLKPIEDREKTAREREEGQARWDESLSRQKETLAGAHKNWSGFTEHFADIKAYLTANKRASLHDAYISAVVPKLVSSSKGAEAAARKQVLADMSAARPKNVASPGKLPTPLRGEGSMDDAVEQAIRAAAHSLR